LLESIQVLPEKNPEPSDPLPHLDMLVCNSQVGDFRRYANVAGEATQQSYAPSPIRALILAPQFF
jgi:hypothetical protein